MPIISTIGAASSRGFGEFTSATAGKFIENYFSTYLYDGPVNSKFSIQNGIELSQTDAWINYKISSANAIYARAFGVDSAGNMYVGGLVGSVNRAFLCKLDPAGNVLWQKLLYTGNSSLYGKIAVDSSGNIHVCGNITGGYSQTFTAKFDSSGTLIWQRTAYILYACVLYDLAIDSSGNVFVCGFVRTGSSATTSQATIIKYNSSGTLQWKKRIAANTFAYGIGVTSSGNVIFCGQDNSNTRVFICALDSTGAVVWQKTETTVIGTFYKLFIDSADNIFVSAGIQQSSASNAYVIKFNSSGVVQWQRRFYPDSSYTAIWVDSNGSVFVGGDGPSAALLAKYDSSGSFQWMSTFSKSGASTQYLTGLNNNVYLCSYATDGTISGLIVKASTGSLPPTGVAIYTVIPNTGTESAGTLSMSDSTYTISDSGATDYAAAVTEATASLTYSLASQKATNGSGLVWFKRRANGIDNHLLFDTVRGANNYISSNTTAGQTTIANNSLVFNPNGFSIAASTLMNATVTASWTFRESPNFLDIITYTGDGTAGQTISHNLNSAIGMIFVKPISATGDWGVWYNNGTSNNNGKSGLSLNTTSASTGAIANFSNADFQPYYIRSSAGARMNTLGVNYVAYVFAHNAGGFGVNGQDSVINCGIYTGNGSTTGPSVSLGWEPQFILIKDITSGAGSWNMFDNFRGIATTGADPYLWANSTNEEVQNVDLLDLTSTGFNITSTNSEVNTNGTTYIYMAIRRGPMAKPTSGTSVFMPTVYTGTNVDNRLVTTTVPPDMVWVRQRNDTVLGGMVVGDRLRCQPYLLTGATAAEVNDANAFDAQLSGAFEYGTAFSSMTGFYCGNDATAKLNASTTASNQIAESFVRAPSFFDMVTYTGSGANRTISHNLTVAPELMMIKRRGATNAWAVYSSGIANTEYLVLNTNAAKATGTTYWNSTTPTSTVFSLGTSADVNASTATYVAYLFATCAGVSKVGTYTGTGAAQTINCGFSTGARFILIKRTDSTGDWFVYDTARGISAGNDPYILLDSTAAEVTTTNYINTDTTGFALTATAPADLNANGGTYIYVAIA